MTDIFVLPDNLPVPTDDGACAHLEGSKLPSVVLSSTSGRNIDLSAERGIVIVYFYSLTGVPGSLPMSGWNEIPGARGCTPQSCAFRDHHAELKRLGAAVYGASAQPLAQQKEAVVRLHLPFELLNDSALEFAAAMKLPTFEFDSARLIKRLTLIIENGEIRKVFYPVFPPDKNATDIIAWLEARAPKFN